LKTKGQKAPSVQVDEQWPIDFGKSSKPKPIQQPKPKAFSSFVAPRAAKPSESKITDLTPAIAAGHPFESGFRIVPIGIACEGILPLGGLHRPTYSAQGPP
jgi:hypothetical protein